MPKVPRWKRKMHTHAVVGRLVRQFRAEHGLTQRAVAQAAGCHPTAVSSLELCYCGSIELVEVILWALGLGLEDLKVSTRGRG